ncbi:hypothetical protein Pint_01125 [Pistacia integerrima]|uniref:Uncharacterized protein n=1 Tax=Pistacia integerrima TaxID=434235 RepID=A0ACC0ZFN9_9ROSI|nr:hypothetical protein Pint_01125 [Pistacia integerrima]
MKDNPVQKSNKWLKDLSEGVIGHELEALTLQGLQIVNAYRGFVRCNFTIPIRLADNHGNWQVGAMATLIDDVGAAAIYSFAGHIKASVDFIISFYSSVKIMEEVEIEAKVVGERGRLTSVKVEVRRKDNGEVIALGKQWMVSNSINAAQGKGRMATSPFPLFITIGLHLLFFTAFSAATTSSTGIRLGIIRKPSSQPHLSTFREAPAFRNGDSCDTQKIHVTMTLDANYLRGTMAAVLSILQHSTCPENFEFHFLWAHFEPDVSASINSAFPYLNFHVYKFDSSRVRGKISKSIRQALDQPLNYARIYLADIIPADVKRVIYLDSDLVVVDDVAKLWEVDLEGKVLAAPEYCHANFTNYFTELFWSDKSLAKTFDGRQPCYFNTGVMVVDVDKWRQGGYTRKVEEWMSVQKQKRIYHLGSLPPFLLVLAGNIKGVDHRWNQHGLGGDNIEGKCRSLHPGPISLLHWSGKGKPWLRLDSRKPCTVDHLWTPYDLYRPSIHSLEE